MSAKILLLQQKDGLRQAKSLVFGGAYFHTLALKDFDDVNDYLSREPVDVILADCRGAEAKGMEMVETLRKEQPKAKIVLVTDALDLPLVVKSIRLGVKDVFHGALDLRSVTRSLGDLAASKETPVDDLRKADWAPLNDFFSAPGSPDQGPKAAPPPSRRSGTRFDPGGDDTAERKALAAEREKLAVEAIALKKLADEIEQKRQTLADSERKLREGGATRSPFGSSEEALRREREQLRLQVAELESERDLYLHQLEQKEKSIAELTAELAKARQGGPAPVAAAPAPPPERIVEKVVETVVEQVVDMALVDEARAEAARVREQLAQCESERDQVKGFLSAKEKALSQATATLQKLQAEAVQFETRLREARNAQATGKASDDTLRTEIEQVRVKLASIEGERDFLREQMAAMETELSVARDANDRLHREIEDWKVRVESAEQQSAAGPAATADEAAWRRERDQLQQKVAKLESERTLAREHLASKEKALGEANATVQKLKLEVVQFEKKLRERKNVAASAATPADTAAIEAELRQAQERLGMIELERDQARDQLTSREAALALANATVESLREEIDHYAERLRNAPAGTVAPANDEALKAERDALRNRLARAESERDNARELLVARERALKEAHESLRRLRTETDLASARTLDESSRRELEIAAAEERLARAHADLQSAQDKVDESWQTLRQEQTLVEERRRQLEEHAVALSNRERLLALERAKKPDTAGAEEIGAAERRLRLLRTELASLAAALNEREAALRTQEARVEQLLARADGDMRQVAILEQQVQERSSEIELRIVAAEKRAAEIIANAQARAEAEDHARSGITEALRLERASVRKAEARYVQACQEVGEQLQALADREAVIRKREYQLDERENAIRGVLQKILSDASALNRGERPAPAPTAEEAGDAKAALSKIDDARQALESGRRAFDQSSQRISEVARQINL
ncbi:response regulator [Nibricoccus sp. IMCC34717]|uniref:response regulator n=1 Tax=Nibricoccus sp. IMCC34717 TaxID=3034021 RepID=UPI00384B1FD8